MTERVDVCIVTDLRFPGGNASSTLDELDTFAQAGLRVLAVHCPSNSSDRKPVSERYERHTERWRAAWDVTEVHAHWLLVRNPGVLCSDSWLPLQPRLKARHAAVIVNNSMFRAHGGPAYDPAELARRVKSIDADSRRIFPIGPLIREELQRYLSARITPLLAPFDWSPTFDLGNTGFSPRAALGTPRVIGRHARDAPEKWPEDPEQLRAAYPELPGVEVHILGGAATAEERLGGRLPDNWRVLPFGGEPVAQFLARLDAFVYFPHPQLREAFGRTVVEAVAAGVPCILSPQLQAAFGDWGFFCAPEQVPAVLERLATDDERRLRFLHAVRAAAQQRLSSPALLLRLRALEQMANNRNYQPADLSQALPPELKAYQKWVETGSD